jgi:hypothetical protein
MIDEEKIICRVEPRTTYIIGGDVERDKMGIPVHLPIREGSKPKDETTLADLREAGYQVFSA